MAHAPHNLIQRAETLVRERILGTRKGHPDQPKHLHSFRVSSLLRKHGFNEDVCLAGLLHDVIEDGGVTVRELQEQGISENVIKLVLLCTHDNNIQHKDLRWLLMIVNLAKADSRDAWAIKLADVLDNFVESHGLSRQRSDFMRDVKIPTLLKASEQQLSWTKLWGDLNRIQARTIESTLAIEKNTAYVLNEITNVLKLSEEVKNAVLGACKQVSDTNYALSNPRLFEAICGLHDLMEKFSKDDSSGGDAPALAVLGNTLCGDMLSHLKHQHGLFKNFQAKPHS